MSEPRTSVGVRDKKRPPGQQPGGLVASADDAYGRRDVPTPVRVTVIGCFEQSLPCDILVPMDDDRSDIDDDFDAWVEDLVKSATPTPDGGVVWFGVRSAEDALAYVLWRKESESMLARLTW